MWTLEHARDLSVAHYSSCGCSEIMEEDWKARDASRANDIIYAKVGSSLFRKTRRQDSTPRAGHNPLKEQREVREQS